MSKLWADVKIIFQDICKHSDRKLTVASDSFINFIGAGSVDKLDGFPDIWSSDKKACYLFTILAADKSKAPRKSTASSNNMLGPHDIWSFLLMIQLGKVNFSCPPGKALISELLKYERSKRIPNKYYTNDVYDYLRLCRNVIKHWKKFCANVSLLKVTGKYCRNVRLYGGL